MSSLPELEACLSILPSALPAPGSTINTTIFGVVFMLVVAAGIAHYASPLRLTRVLVAAIANVENTYLEALETGLLSASDIDTAELLSTLQLKVSKIREATLRNSLSHSGTLREFFEGHTFTLLRCIHEMRVLETHIEILKENQLREDNLHPFADHLPNNTTTKFAAAVLLVIVVTCILYYASPRRLMGVLVTAIASVEKTYFDALETGLLSPSDVHMAEMLHTLQITVSEIREASLRNSLSLRSTFRECLNGRTFTILYCIREVRMLETHIEACPPHLLLVARFQ
ncbi:hypothetical protein B0H13DRAFT_2524425 [Mycena leptocephala]|nr:hypothetical protein B0H13DRAFT_2524425 [Mycena leptocephala]